jgi:hypothetical protein
MPAGDAELAANHTRAWMLLTAALALHVTDEAATGFLDFYNPLVLDIRSRVSWFPMPTFTFGRWLTGLVALVIVLALLGAVVRSSGLAAQLLSWPFSGLMLLNGVGHLTGSFYFGRWLPGTTSAPLLIWASGLLAWRASERWSRPFRDHRET